MIYITQKDGFTHTYSDTFFIRKIGTDEIYSGAMDLTAQQYEETDTPLPIAEPTEANRLEERVQAVETDIDSVIEALDTVFGGV